MTRTLWEQWSTVAARDPDRDAIVHWDATAEAPFRWTWGMLVARAERLATALLANGVEAGQVCALMMRHNRHLYPLYLACSRIGAIPAILAYPNARLHPNKFRQGIEGMSQRSGLDWILMDRDLEAWLAPLVGSDRTTIRGLLSPLEWNELDDATPASGLPPAPSDPTAPALLQHSSGTTGLQKPVMLSHHAVLEHVNRYGATIEASADDVVVSWLPLYHDMGLIAAFHLPLASGIPTVQIDPFEWVMAPQTLLDAVTRERGTLSWLPNFAYDMMADKIGDDRLGGIDLTTWRAVVNCSEPVRHESHVKFAKRFAPYGLRAEALSTCYAMAETTFAVTQSTLGRQPGRLTLDRAALQQGRVEMASGGTARECLSSGTSIDGCELRIVAEDGTTLGDRRVGEIAIRSVSLFDGYRNYPEKTADVLRHGWYYSGDHGFTDGDELYVIGRKKDLIITAGNNVFPEDVEAAVSTVDGVLPGRVVAFGEDDPALGSERVAVIAETSLTDDASRKKLKIAVIKAGMAIDVSIAAVYLAPPRFLIKSSAGKPSRLANKNRVGELLSPVSTAP
jgi:fatty-acyl-CoA synthase